MNERLKELMIQADYPAPELALRAHRLAELIISDIVGAIRGLQIDAQEDGMLNIASTCDTIAVLLEQDYGVKNES